MSSFMFFAHEKRPEVKEKYPDLKLTQIGKKLSEIWKTVPPEEKKVYEMKAASDKERFNNAMSHYKPIEEVTNRNESASSSSSSDSDSPSEESSN